MNDQPDVIVTDADRAAAQASVRTDVSAPDSRSV